MAQLYNYYYRTTDPTVLGAPNELAALGNPLKGLAGGSRYAPVPLPDAVPLSVEFFNIGLDEMMTGPNKFDWTTLESLLAGAASRNMHVVIAPYIHWPGQPLRLPRYLVGKIQMMDTDDQGPIPWYGDAVLLKAIQQFIVAFGATYNGDRRILAISLGLLGYWGEFHCFPHDCVPETAATSVVRWYQEAFPTTKLLARYPKKYTRNLGLYDGSFSYATIDGAPNGGVKEGWFFWPQVTSQGMTSAWRTAMMGGETRPENQSLIFRGKNKYPAGTEKHQDFVVCADTIHATFILHHDAFINGGYTGKQLRNALTAHAHLGYNFYISKVAVAASLTSGSCVDICVTVQQAGIAPFYYDLALRLDSAGLPRPMKLDGVEQIIDPGAKKTFTFKGVPATHQCLDSVSFTLKSSYAYPNRPIRFAQGPDGRVRLTIPLPPG